MSISNTNLIYEFNLEKIKEGASVLIIGERWSGKSCLIRHIINNKGWNNATTVHHHFILRTLLADMKIQTDQHRVIVLDDCLVGPTTGKLLFNNKQSNTTLIIAQQDPYEILSEFRKNFDYVFAFNDDSGASAEHIRVYYTWFAAPAVFRKAFDCITENNKVMVIDVDIRNRNVFWYRFIPEFTTSIDSDDEPEVVNSILWHESVSEPDDIPMPEATVETDNAGHTCTLL